MIWSLIIVFGLLIYAAISFLAIWLARRYAIRKGRSPVRWGWGAAVVMYLLLFWDWIPAEIVYAYSCSEKAGFTQFKTLEQWKAENSGRGRSPMSPDTQRRVTEKDWVQNRINERLDWTFSSQITWFGIEEKKEEIVDSVTGEVLAQYVDYSVSWKGGGPDSFQEMKIWIGQASCEPGDSMPEKILFNDLLSDFESLGRME